MYSNLNRGMYKVKCPLQLLKIYPYIKKFCNYKCQNKTEQKESSCTGGLDACILFSLILHDLHRIPIFSLNACNSLAPMIPYIQISMYLYTHI